MNISLWPIDSRRSETSANVPSFSNLSHHDVDLGDGGARRAFLRTTITPFLLWRSLRLLCSTIPSSFAGLMVGSLPEVRVVLVRSYRLCCRLFLSPIVGFEPGKFGVASHTVVVGSFTGLFVTHNQLLLVGQTGFVLWPVLHRSRSGFEVVSQIRIILGLNCFTVPHLCCHFCLASLARVKWVWLVYHFNGSLSSCFCPDLLKSAGFKASVSVNIVPENLGWCLSAWIRTEWPEMALYSLFVTTMNCWHVKLLMCWRSSLLAIITENPRPMWYPRFSLCSTWTVRLERVI